jgi:hypothetical protein
MARAATDTLDSDNLASLLGSDELQAFKDEFKTRVLDPLLKEIKGIKKDDIKKMLNPLGIDTPSKDFLSEIEKYRKKIKDSLNVKLPENTEDNKEQPQAKKDNPIKDTPAAAVLPNVESDKKQQSDGEQKEIGPTAQIIEFSDKTQAFLKDIFKNVKPDEKAQEELRKYFKESLGKQDALLSKTEDSGFLGMIGKILAIGGIATLLVTAFWDKIKPWLENAIGTKLDFLDKFKGIAEFIGRFFTTGGLRIAFGGITDLVGKAFMSFGDLIEGVLKGAIKMILPAGKGALEGGAEAATKGGGIFKGLLPRLAGGLFKGVGMTVLKGIPLIGSLISLYFAYDRFKSGDYVGAVIDLVGGLANILEFTPLAPLALPISLGAAALNAFLDYKAGDAQDKKGAKLGALGGMLTGFYGFLKKVPIIGTILNGVEGLWGFVSGLATGDFNSVKSGLEQMAAVPLFGAVPMFLLGFLDSATIDKKGNITGYDSANMMDNFKKRVGKTILGWFSWLPSSWQAWIAEKLGVEFNGNANEDQQQNQTQAAPPTPQAPPPTTQAETKAVKNAVAPQPAPKDKVDAIKDEDLDNFYPDLTKEERDKLQKRREAIFKQNAESVKKEGDELKQANDNVAGIPEELKTLSTSFADDKQKLEYKPESKEAPKILNDNDWINKPFSFSYIIDDNK